LITADTNVFVYAVDLRYPIKKRICADILAALASRRAPVGLQVAGEVFSVLSGHMRRPPWEAAQASRNLLASGPSFGTTRYSIERALAEAATGRFSFWDANLLSAAEEAGCTHMISEDMADGVRLGRIEVVHPFAKDGGLSDRARDLLFRKN
jgi:predicted nucleic acid-binding protein